MSWPFAVTLGLLVVYGALFTPAGDLIWQLIRRKRP